MGVGDVTGKVVVVVVYVKAVNPRLEQGSTYGVRVGVGVGVGDEEAVTTGTSQLNIATKSTTLHGSVVVVVVIQIPE